jgi:hypothetical protein
MIRAVAARTSRFLRALWHLPTNLRKVRAASEKERHSQRSNQWDEIIKGFERAMTLSGYGYGQPYYVENLTIKCLQEMARVDGWNGPQSGEYLYRWKSRAPEGARQLTEFVETRLRTRLSHLQAEEKAAQEREAKRRCEVYRQWFEAKKSLLDKFLEVAERRVSLLDDYGDENWDSLPKEIDRFLLKI